MQHTTSVGDVRRFPSGRHFASYLGLTLREHSSGGRRRLGGISKQGDRYLRTLLMHAARGTLSHSLHPTKPTPFRAWARTVAQRRGSNIATAAVANRLARMVWRVWRDDRPFTPSGPSPRSHHTLSLDLVQEDCRATDGSPSDRRGDTPTSWLATRAVRTIGIPARDFHRGPEH